LVLKTVWHDICPITIYEFKALFLAIAGMNGHPACRRGKLKGPQSILAFLVLHYTVLMALNVPL
jgi:hypothetical protein